MESYVRRERNGTVDELLERVLGQVYQCDCPEKLCAQDLSNCLQALGDGTCIASLAGGDAKNAELLARAFQDKCHQYDCSDKLCAHCAPKTCQSFQTQGHGTCIASLAGSETKRVQLLAQAFQDKFHQCDVLKYCAPQTCQMVCKRWAMGHA